MTYGVRMSGLVMFWWWRVVEDVVWFRLLSDVRVRGGGEFKSGTAMAYAHSQVTAGNRKHRWPVILMIDCQE